MRHLLRDEEKEKALDGAGITIFSCEADEGKRIYNNHVTVGDGGLVYLFMCQSCYEQIKGQILGDIVKSAVKESRPKWT